MRSLILVSILIASVVNAADPPQPVRKRVGITFSGGSALGLAHVGVIQWLEEHHIPVSYVTGTSMGGLVGGVYATGHDAVEIKEFVRTINWARVFSAGAPYENLDYRRKEDRRQFQNSLEFGLKGGFKPPSGLSSGSEVSLVISRIAAPWAVVDSYDNLPIPFRCVAADLIGGNQVVFSSGSLYTALRSTMSIPAIFSPLPVGNMLLVDGGILNNLPVDIAKQMGAEYTIAVVLDSPPVTAEGLDRILPVARRSLSVMLTDNELRNRKLADLVIAPDLKGLNSDDFAKYEEFEKRGYEAAEKQKLALMAFAVSDEEWNTYLEGRRKKRRPESITAKFVEVRGVEGDVKAKMTEFLEAHAKDEPLNRPELDKALTRLTGLASFQSANYDFISKDGAEGLGVNIISKSWGPPFLDIGLNIEGSDTANIRFAFGGRLTFIDIGGYASEWRTDFTVGLKNSLSSEYYKRLRGSKWFLAPNVSIAQQREDVYENNTRTGEYKMRSFLGGADVGYAISRFSEFRAGYVYDHRSLSLATGTLPEESNLRLGAANFQTMRVLYAYDHQDNPVIPRNGLHATTDARWNFHSGRDFAQYGTIEQRFSYSKFLKERYILATDLIGGATVGPQAYYPQFSLGGPGQLAAYGLGQLRGDYSYLGGLYGLRAISPDPTKALNRFYFTVGCEMGQAFTRIDEGKPAFDGLAGITGATPIGVVFMGYSVGTEGNHRFFFRIGKSF